MNWIMLISIESISIYIIVQGVRKIKTFPDEKFGVKDFFQSGSIQKTPGKVLISEGLFGIILGLLIFFI